MAHSLLSDLRSKPENLEKLSSLQHLLIKEIVVAEKKIRGLKKKLSLVSNTGNDPAGNATTYIRNRINSMRQVAFVWRCFGDAIAYIYLDKFALKHTLYSTENFNPKQSAGFLLDKQGLQGEISVMEQGLEAGIPTLLTDLTNTIRHGDVCFMVGSDPHLVEVKSGHGLNQRGRRQVKHLKKLQEFFANDRARGFRGLPEIRRIAHETAEWSYIDEMNACIDAAAEDGWAISNPERGLYYIAIGRSGMPIKDIFAKISVEYPLVFMLNTYKTNRTWVPYLPFTLTIKAEPKLYEFLQGRLCLFVVYDINVFLEIGSSRGVVVDINFEDEVYPIGITKSDPMAYVRISSHMLTRIGLDFTSPEWILIASLEEMQGSVPICDCTQAECSSKQDVAFNEAWLDEAEDHLAACDGVKRR